MWVLCYIDHKGEIQPTFLAKDGACPSAQLEAIWLMRQQEPILFAIMKARADASPGDWTWTVSVPGYGPYTYCFRPHQTPALSAG